MGVAALGLWAFARVRRVGRGLMVPLTAVCLLLGAQGVVGLVQYHNALPAELVWIHASLPALLWACLVWSWQAAGPLAAATRRAGDRVGRTSSSAETATPVAGRT
jgi:heme A synthase